MAGRSPRDHRASPVARVQPPAVADSATQRAIDVLAGALQDQQSKRQYDVVQNVDLVVGTNKVTHGLGRACVGYNLTATVADATFAHAIDTDNTHPEREVWITVVGVDQPAATIEVY